jgi:hypothetical protein
MCKPPSPFVVTAEFAELARKLADWAAAATGTTVYLYGSRVRGDHNANSDVDLCIEFPNPTRADNRLVVREYPCRHFAKCKHARPNWGDDLSDLAERSRLMGTQTLGRPPAP